MDEFLYASLNEVALEIGLLLKERICSSRGKFFLLRVDPTEKGDKKILCLLSVIYTQSP